MYPPCPNGDPTMRKFKFLAVALLGFGLASTALAEKKGGDEEVTTDEEAQYKQIKLGKISEFRPTWKNAKEIQDSVTAFETKINEVNSSIKEAAGIAQDAPLEKAFTDMKETAGDKLKVTINSGKMPELSAEDAPDNVKAFVDTVNGGVDTCKSVIEGAKEMPGQIQALIEEAKGMPSQLTPSILKDNGLKAKDLKPQKAVIAGNIEALKETKGRAQGVLAAAEDIVAQVKSLTPAKR